MNELNLHQSVRNQLISASKKMPHALLLAGSAGVGLQTIAKKMAKSLAKHFILVEPDEKGTISIETIRDLYTKTRSKQIEKQMIIIDDADAMSIAAQNAFLKLLEEPTDQTSFLLTTHMPERLLSTIRSRVQLINIQQITPNQTEQQLDALKVSDKRKRQQLAFIAMGLPAELSRLTQDEEYFSEQASLAKNAREFLSSKQYDRIVSINKISSDRDQAIQLIDHIARILKYSLQNNAKSNLALQLDKTLQTAESIKNNGHVRTQLLQLAISL